MRVYRSAPERNFTVLPNRVLQDNGLSLAARGLLAYLVSLPDGTPNDIRTLALKLKEGRGAVSRALDELKDAGYYFVVRWRGHDGLFHAANHIFDTPQERPPLPTSPGSGDDDSGDQGETQEEKNGGKEPPSPPAAEPSEPAEPEALSAPAPNPEAALLYRVTRSEPRLRLGVGEAATLAPLVAEWLERGATEHDLRAALLPGLPDVVHHAVAFLRTRLQRKMPAPRTPTPPRCPHECAKCRVPVPTPGICRSCAGMVPPLTSDEAAATTAKRGMAAVRAALNAARQAPAPA